jgi:hypothetical protein
MGLRYPKREKLKLNYTGADWINFEWDRLNGVRFSGEPSLEPDNMDSINDSPLLTAELVQFLVDDAKKDMAVATKLVGSKSLCHKIRQVLLDMEHDFNLLELEERDRQFSFLENKYDGRK